MRVASSSPSESLLAKRASPILTIPAMASSRLSKGCPYAASTPNIPRTLATPEPRTRGECLDAGIVLADLVGG